MINSASGSEYYRAQAQSLRDAATLVKDQTVKDDLRRYADEWDRLALLAEEEERRAWRRWLEDCDWRVSRFRGQPR